MELECYERKQQMTKINTISADPHMLPDTVSWESSNRTMKRFQKKTKKREHYVDQDSAKEVGLDKKLIVQLSQCEL